MANNWKNNGDYARRCVPGEKKHLRKEKEGSFYYFLTGMGSLAYGWN